MNTMCNFYAYGDSMKKYLSSQGNGWLLYINKEFCELMGVNKNNQEIAITTYENELIIEKLDLANEENHDFKIIKKVITRGNGFGIYISQALLEILNINPEIDKVNIEIQNAKLTVKKA